MRDDSAGHSTADGAPSDRDRRRSRAEPTTDDLVARQAQALRALRQEWREHFLIAADQGSATTDPTPAEPQALLSQHAENKSEAAGPSERMRRRLGKIFGLFGMMFLVGLALVVTVFVVEAMRRDNSSSGSNDPASGASVITTSEIPIGVGAALQTSPTAAEPAISPTEAGTSADLGFPSSMVSGAPTSSPTESSDPSANEVVRRVAEAESALKSGQLEATLDYGGGNRTAATLAFSFGDSVGPARYHVRTVYAGPNGSEKSEHIAVGGRAWELAPNGSWLSSREQEGAWGQVQPFLPQAKSARAAQMRVLASFVELQWSDGDKDVFVLANPMSGIPREMRRVSRSTGSTLVVTYSGWNTPVEITPPAGVLS